MNPSHEYIILNPTAVQRNADGTATILVWDRASDNYLSFRDMMDAEQEGLIDILDTPNPGRFIEGYGRTPVTYRIL